MRDKLHM